MTAIPALNGRSAAHAAKEEYDGLIAELRQATEENEEQRALIIELNVRCDSLEGHIMLLRQQLGFERARGDRYASYTQAMGAMLDPIIEACDAHANLVAGSFKKAKQMALEAAQEVSREKVVELTHDEEERLQALVTHLAPNQLS